MNVEELKRNIIEIFGNVSFNKEFKKHAKQLNSHENNFLEWCKLVADKKILSDPSSVDKGIVIFVKKIGSSNRCVVLKQKNGVFMECHLGDHKYYDDLRKKIGL